jgi:hypothetical protein
MTEPLHAPPCVKNVRKDDKFAYWTGAEGKEHREYNMMQPSPFGGLEFHYDALKRQEAEYQYYVVSMN